MVRSNLASEGGFLDKTGATVSWVCAAHCVAMPFLVSFLPLFGLSFVASEGFEYFFIGLSISVGAFSLLPGYFRRHGKLRTLLIFAGGISLVSFADAIFPESFLGKAVIVILGAGLITTSHIINRRLCRACRACSINDDRSLT